MHPASTFTVARSSPRVAPRLTITTGTPARAARRTNRKPLITVSDEPDHEQGVVGRQRVDGVVAPLHPGGRDVLAEEHHVGLEHAAAAVAVGDDEPGGVVEVDVAVGSASRPSACGSAKPGLAAPSGVPRAAPGSSYAGRRGRRRRRSGRAARRADASPAASCRPSTFWVISRSGSSAGQRAVPGVGLGAAHPAPAEVAARPVALPRGRAADELLVGHRLPRRASPARGSRGCRSRSTARRR